MSERERERERERAGRCEQQDFQREKKSKQAGNEKKNNENKET